MQPHDIATRLRQRMRVIRLQNAELARATGLDQATIARFLRGRAALTSTLARIEAALLAEEISVRDQLNALHPPNGKGKDT